MKKLIFPIAVSLLAAVTGCDKVSEEDYLEKVNVVRDTTFFSDTTVIEDIQDLTRHALVEDYTGHTCGNCPRAAEIAHEIHDEHGDRVVVMAVHAGFFAKPKTSGTMYLSDYRTPEGESLDAMFGNSTAGNPNGLINRIDFPTAGQVKQIDSWSVLVDAELNKSLVTKLSTKVLYKDSTRTLRVNTRTTFLSAHPRNTNIVVYLTEDSIINWQKDYRLPSGQQDISNYVHQHMLRASLNGTYGQTLTSAPATAGQVVSAYINYEIPATFVAKNCNLVIAVLDAETNEVLQVKGADILE